MAGQRSTELGDFIIRLREAKGWSQREAANALGVSNSLLSQLESGTRELGKKLEKSMQETFSLPPGWINRLQELKIETVDEKISRLQENIGNISRIRDGLLYKLREQKKVFIFVIGDLCVDEIELFEDVKGTTTETASPESGGQGLNAAIAFQPDDGTKSNYISILFGGVGRDHDGEKIIDDIENRHIISLVKAYPGKITGRCDILFNMENRKKKYSLKPDNPHDANDYSASYLRQMLEISGIDKEGLIYLVATVFPRYKQRHKKFEEYADGGEPGKNPFESYRQDFTAFTGEVMQALHATGAPLIIRIPQAVGGDSYAEGLNLDEFNLLTYADFLIGEYATFVQIFKNEKNKPGSRYNIDIRDDNGDEEKIIKNIEYIVKQTNGPVGQYLLFFYGGVGNMDSMIFGRRGANGAFDTSNIPLEKKTGYADVEMKNKDAKTAAKKRIGFVERQIAGLIWKHDPRNPDAEKSWKWEWPKRNGE
jgi:transcriptional regulator with XRE-family HTH domain